MASHNKSAAGRTEAARKGGENSHKNASQHQGTNKNSRTEKNNIRDEQSSQYGGRGHELTQEDRRKGGAHSHGRKNQDDISFDE